MIQKQLFTERRGTEKRHARIDRWSYQAKNNCVTSVTNDTDGARQRLQIAAWTQISENQYTGEKYQFTENIQRIGNWKIQEDADND